MLDDLDPAPVEVAEHEVVEGEVLDPPDPHGVVATRHTWGVALVCRCLAWEAAVTGPGSLRYAQGDHARHVAEVTRGE